MVKRMIFLGLLLLVLVPVAAAQTANITIIAPIPSTEQQRPT